MTGLNYDFDEKPETDIPMLDIELVRGCTLNCRWCPVDKILPVRFMDLTLFERMAQDSLLHRIGYRRFSLFLGGEPLLHPQFGEALRILRDLGYRQANYRKIQIFTNGVALTEERAREIIHTDVITRVSISIDGVGDPDSLNYMRPPTKIDEIIRNVRCFMEYHAEAKSSLEVVIASIFPRPGQVPFEVPSLEEIRTEFLKRFGPLGIEKFEYRFLRDEYNNPNWRVPAHRDPNRPCYLAKDRKLVVLYNGDVAICSRKLNGESTIGEVRTMDLLSVWNTPEFRRVRQARCRGDFDYRSDLCRECDCGPLREDFLPDPCEYGPLGEGAGE